MDLREHVRHHRELHRLLAGRNPPRRLRRALPRQRQPDHLRLQYFSALREQLQRARDLVEARLLPTVRRLLPVTVRSDAGPGDVNAMADEVADEFMEGLSSKELDNLARRFAHATSELQREQLGQQLQAATGVQVPIQDGELGVLVDDFTARNVALIKTIPRRYFADVEQTVIRAVSDGTRWEELAEELGERYEVAESVANRIARDQVGKLYGALNGARQEELGIQGFIWRTMNDNRVRDEHIELAGQKFRWDDPPSEGIPGEPINCRCYAEPDLSFLH